MSRARLPIVFGGVAVILASVVGGLTILRTRSPVSSDLPIPLPVPAAVTLPTRVVPPDASTVAPPAVAAPAPTAPGSAAADTLQQLLAELNSELPQLGVQPPARLTAATVESKLLVLTFSPEFRPFLTDLSALDELTAALSSRVRARGYHHLDLRLLDTSGHVRSVAELTSTPKAQRPRPEPIDDGVRR